MTSAELLSLEQRLAERLRRPDLFDGAADLQERKARVRALCQGLHPVLAGRGPDRKPETYSALFARMYGEPLQPRGVRAAEPTREATP